MLLLWSVRHWDKNTDFCFENSAFGGETNSKSVGGYLKSFLIGCRHASRQVEICFCKKKWDICTTKHIEEGRRGERVRRTQRRATLSLGPSKLFEIPPMGRLLLVQLTLLQVRGCQPLVTADSPSDGRALVLLLTTFRRCTTPSAGRQEGKIGWFLPTEITFFFVEFCCVLSGYLSTKWSDQRREGRGRGVNCLFFSNFFLDKSDKWMGEIMFRKNRKLLKRERERESKSNCIGGYARPMAAAVDTLTITVQHTPQFRPESFNPSTTFRKDQLPEMPVVRTSERSGGLFRVFFSLFDFFFYTKKNGADGGNYLNNSIWLIKLEKEARSKAIDLLCCFIFNFFS